MITVLKCVDVCKKNILKNISFEIEEGDVIGLIGPNGAGKTTLIKLILSLQHKSSGNIYINNYDIDNDYNKAIKSVGAIVENPEFYNYMSGRKNLKLKCRLYNISNERLEEVIELVGLKKRIDDRVSTYSLGMKQRLGIAEAILNKPQLLILDEPTNGLDPEGIKLLRDVIMKLSKENMSILVSSHILRELDDICNKVCIIKNGEIINMDYTDKIKHKDNNYTYIFNVSNTDNINLLFENEIIDENRFKVTCNKEFIPLIIECLVKENINIYEVKEEEYTLERIFLEEVIN